MVRRSSAGPLMMEDLLQVPCGQKTSNKLSLNRRPSTGPLWIQKTLKVFYRPEDILKVFYGQISYRFSMDGRHSASPLCSEDLLHDIKIFYRSFLATRLSQILYIKQTSYRFSMDIRCYAGLPEWPEWSSMIRKPFASVP